MDKAISKGYEDDDISESISELTKKNFINDTRYCQNIIEYYKNYKGPLWIKQKLISKKIPNTIINQELSKYNLIPSQNLKKKILNKHKIKNFIDLEMSTKQKILSFLSRKWFTTTHSTLFLLGKILINPRAQQPDLRHAVHHCHATLRAREFQQCKFNRRKLLRATCLDARGSVVWTSLVGVHVATALSHNANRSSHGTPSCERSALLDCHSRQRRVSGGAAGHAPGTGDQAGRRNRGHRARHPAA
ncbi:MAG: RecX family transcriptional regulator [Thermales bacterium]|nr:RecX family transcriptional regulator [Thermales bacterium]